MTDKGSLNARALLDNREELLAELYQDKASPRVMVAKSVDAEAATR
jgi:hypothetical protein